MVSIQYTSKGKTTEGTNKSNQYFFLSFFFFSNQYFISQNINLVQLIFTSLTQQQAQSRHSINVS